MKKLSRKKIGVIVLISVAGMVAVLVGGGAPPEESTNVDAAENKAMMTVTAVAPQSNDWPQTVSANGDIAAWQEALVGSELNGQRLAEVLVNVGDNVRKQQVLARFASETVAAELAQQEAAREEAAAALAEAQANAERTRTLTASGALSAQQTSQYLTAERSAKARLMSADARVKIEQIRLRQVEVLSPDDGVISSRSATLGAVLPQGQELFRLIRKSRLEWRAELPANDLLLIKPGQPAKLTVSNGVTINGTVRIAAPTVDPATRSATVYVDLPISNEVHAGTFAKGEIVIGRSSALSVPNRSVVMRDGYAYVYQVGADNKVVQTRVTLGRHFSDRVEVLDGVSAAMQVVDKGSGFLADGDTVKVVNVPGADATEVASIHTAEMPTVSK